MNKDKDKLFAVLIKSIANINSDKECAHAVGVIAHNITESDAENKLLLLKYLVSEARCINDDFYIADLVRDFSAEVKNLKNEEKYEMFEFILAYERSIYTDEDRIDSLKNISEQIVNNKDISGKNKAILFNRIIERTKNNIRNDKKRAYAVGIVSECISEVNMGDNDKTYKAYLIDKIVGIIRNLEHSCKPDAYGKVVKSMLESGIGDTKMFDKVVNSIKSVVSSMVKTDILKQIIDQLSYLSTDDSINFDRQLFLLKIIDTTKDIHSDKSRAELYKSIVEELCKIDDTKGGSSTFLFDKLIRQAQTIKNSYHKSCTFEEIIKALAKQGHYKKAISLIKYIDDGKNLMFALIDLSNELANDSEK